MRLYEDDGQGGSSSNPVTLYDLAIGSGGPFHGSSESHSVDTPNWYKGSLGDDCGQEWYSFMRSQWGTLDSSKMPPGFYGTYDTEESKNCHPSQTTINITIDPSAAKSYLETNSTVTSDNPSAETAAYDAFQTAYDKAFN